MFGQNQHHDDNQIPDQSIDAAMNADPEDQPSGAPNPSSWQHPGQPVDDNPPVSSTVPTLTPLHDDQPVDSNTPPTPPADANNDGHANDLLDIKQQALTQLSPLVGHLDQTPEEQFRTTMMMIQASDDQSLVRKAFEAAQKIEDEKARAQALLDVINEINYFTQHAGS